MSVCRRFRQNDCGGSFDESCAIKELAAVFNRGGFTKGYYVNANDIIYKDSPNNTGIRVGKVLSNDGRNILSYDEITKGDGVEALVPIRPGDGGEQGGVGDGIGKGEVFSPLLIGGIGRPRQLQTGIAIDGHLHIADFRGAADGKPRISGYRAQRQ